MLVILVLPWILREMMNIAPRYPELTHSAVCASPSLHPAVVVPLLVPELPVVPGISALIHTVR